jgi:lipopolysaccharide export system protein LptC
MDGGVSVTFFGVGVSDTVSELTSRRAEIDEGRRILTAIENVVLVSNRGSTLYTDTLRWEEETEMIQGPARVRIESDRGTETGIGFEAKSDLSTWTLRQVVTRIDTSSN